MQLSPSDTIVRMFSYGQTILLDLVNFVYALFTTTIRDYFTFLEPYLGPIHEPILLRILDSPLLDYNMLEIFLFSIPAFICFTFIKWLIGIIT